ncbi:hypothetical protein BD311DRAFT_757871 [Dichomitus squalens]|uniref:Uncharacterized protein n=1 Tax=Dichomitus squalens TaxID=114155 RepID=A0A4Q9MMN1_9APHY|nr:hypothetical protein BD311DRAFT_757871 [Dichomitus squalens]
MLLCRRLRLLSTARLLVLARPALGFRWASLLNDAQHRHMRIARATMRRYALHSLPYRAWLEDLETGEICSSGFYLVPPRRSPMSATGLSHEDVLKRHEGDCAHSAFSWLGLYRWETPEARGRLCMQTLV